MRTIKNILRAATLVAVAVLVTACSGDREYDTLSATEFATALADDPNAVVLDVRTSAEVAEGYIPGEEVVFIDFLAPGFEAHAKDLDPSKSYYVYCRSGKRSAQAAGVLANLGFDEVHNLSGGILVWTGDLETP